MKRLLQLLNLKHYFRMFWLWVWHRTSARTRRMFVLAALHAKLVKCSEDDIKALGEVNAEFKLDKDVKALRFPTLFAPLIWKNIACLHEMERATENGEVSNIVQSMPGWLQYGSFDELEADIRHMVRYCFARQQMK